jgi:hypothetical protein
LTSKIPTSVPPGRQHFHHILFFLFFIFIFLFAIIDEIIQVDDVICSALIGHKARTHEPCNTHDCPNWFQGPWSQVKIFFFFFVKLFVFLGETILVVIRVTRGKMEGKKTLIDRPLSSIRLNYSDGPRALVLYTRIESREPDDFDSRVVEKEVESRRLTIGLNPNLFRIYPPV